MARIKAIEAIGDKMDALKNKRVAKHVIRFKNELHRLNHIKPEELIIDSEVKPDNDAYIVTIRTNISISDLALPKGYIEVNGKIMAQESLLNKMSGKSKIRFNVQPLTLSETISEPNATNESEQVQEEIPETEISEAQVVEATTGVPSSAPQNNKPKITLEMLAQEGILNDPEMLQIIINEQQKMLDEMERNKEQSTSKYHACNLFTSNLEKRLELMNALMSNSEKFKTFIADYVKNKADYKDIDEIRVEYDMLIAQAQGLSYFEINKFAYEMEDFEQAKEATERMFKDLIIDKEIPRVDDFNEVVSITYNLVKTEDQEKYFEYVQGLKRQYANIFGINLQNEQEVVVPEAGAPSEPSVASRPASINPSEPSVVSSPNPVNPSEPSVVSSPELVNPSEPSVVSTPAPQPILNSNTSNGVLNDYLDRLNMIENLTIQMINLEIEVNNLENSAINNGLTDPSQLKLIAILNQKIEEKNQQIMEMKMQLSDIEYREFIENNYCIINEPEVITAKARMEQNINASKNMLFGENVEARFDNKNEIMNAAMDILDTKSNEIERQMIITFIKNVHNSKCRYANNLITYVDKNGKKYDSIAILSAHNINIGNLSVNGPVIKPVIEVIESDITDEPVRENSGALEHKSQPLDGLLSDEEIRALLEGIEPSNESELERYRRETLEALESGQTLISSRYYEDRIKYTTDIEEIKGLRSAMELSQQQYKEKHDLSKQATLGFAKDYAIMLIKRLAFFSKTQIKKCIDFINSCQSIDAVNSYIDLVIDINDSMAPATPKAIEKKSEEVVIDVNYREIESNEPQLQEDEKSFADLEQITGISLTEEEPKQEVKEEPKKVEYKVKDIKLNTSSSEPVYQTNLADSVFVEGVDKVKITQTGQKIRIVFTKSILEKLNAMKAKIKRIESAKGTEIRNMSGVKKEKVEDIGNKVRIHYEFNDEDHVAEIEYEEKSSGLSM